MALVKDCSAFLSFIDSYHYPFVVKMKEEGFQGSQGKNRHEASLIKRWPFQMRLPAVGRERGDESEPSGWRSEILKCLSN
jgi:hypothetical protein